MAAIRNSVTKVNQLGYFKLNEENPVEIDTDHREEEGQPAVQGRGVGPHRAAVRRRLERARRLLRPVLHQHQELPRPRRAGRRLGADRQAARLSSTSPTSIPWFLDRPQSIGVRAYDAEPTTTACSRHQDRYIRNSKGAVLTYGRNFRLFQSASISYNLLEVQRRDPDRRCRRCCRRDAAAGRRSAAGQPGHGRSTGSTTRRCGRPTSSTAGTTPSSRPAARSCRSPSSTRAACWAATTTSCGRRSAYSIFQPVSNYPTKTLFAFNVEGG